MRCTRHQAEKKARTKQLYFAIFHSFSFSILMYHEIIIKPFILLTVIILRSL